MAHSSHASIHRSRVLALLSHHRHAPTYLNGGLEQGEGSATLLLGAVLDCMCSRTARR
jgi:hypothetical protein